jgi:hypothetical protein
MLLSLDVEFQFAENQNAELIYCRNGIVDLPRVLTPPNNPHHVFGDNQVVIDSYEIVG